jgi:hypothetical protein
LHDIDVVKNKNLKQNMKMLLYPSKGNNTFVPGFCHFTNNNFISGFHQTWISMLHQWALGEIS